MPDSRRDQTTSWECVPSTLVSSLEVNLRAAPNMYVIDPRHVGNDNTNNRNKPVHAVYSSEGFQWHTLSLHNYTSRIPRQFESKATSHEG